YSAVATPRRTAGGTLKTSSARPERISRAASRWLTRRSSAPCASRRRTVGWSLYGLPAAPPLMLASRGKQAAPKAATPLFYVGAGQDFSRLDGGGLARA